MTKPAATARRLATGPASVARRLGERWLAIKLWKRILFALLLGAGTGAIWGEGAEQIRWVGELFIRLVRMLVVPLVFVMIVAGITALVDLRRLGTIGLKTVALYAATASIAVSIGLAIGELVKPGAGAGTSLARNAPALTGAPRSATEHFLSIVPTNPVDALAQGAMLSVIFFSALLGAGILAAAEKGRPLGLLFESAAAVMLRLVDFVMEVAPFGVFALIAAAVGTSGAQVFVSAFWLGTCVLAGSVLQTFVVHGALVRFGAWRPVRPFFSGISEAMLVGFSTTSSSATLPVAMAVAERQLGLRPAVVSTVLPLGASIGMDGAALYIGILTAFATQAFGVELALSDYLLVVGATVAAAMGTAPVPSASLFMLAAVLAAIGIGPAQAALVVGFILPFDRPLDMMRTVPNVTADLAVATTVARWESEIELHAYDARSRKLDS